MAIEWMLMGALLAAPEASPPRDWSTLLLQDLAAADAAERDSHPGAHDARNPGFAAQMDAALTLARSRAARVDGFAGYWWTLKGYAASFNDGHVSLNPLPGAPMLGVRWPGFLTGFDGDFQVVMTTQDGGAHPPLGARLLSCDGIDAPTLAQQRVGEFNGRWNLQSSRVRAGNEVLLDQGNPFVSVPHRCVFRVHGRETAFALHWQPLDAATLAARVADTRRSERPPNGWRSLREGGYWITTSSFNVDPSGRNFNELTRLVEQLTTQAAALRHAPLVVLDVRGNSGGSSQWSVALARLVWGRAAVDALADDSRVEWRASAANIAYLRAFQQTLQDTAEAAPEMIRMLQTVSEGMAQAAEQGAPLWAEPAAPAATSGIAPERAVPQRPGKVFVVADASCGSACLDALDLWKRLGALQVGVETSADSLYMDVRPEPLPSGLARISVPMKVYRGRARGSNQPHAPDLRYDGDLRDTDALQAWLLAK